MANTGVNVPSGFGGIVRFNEEYDSKMNLSPMQVVFFIVLLVLFRISLSMFF